MEDRAAMKAAGAGQQTVESSGTSHAPMPVESRQAASEEGERRAGADIPTVFH